MATGSLPSDGDGSDATSGSDEEGAGGGDVGEFWHVFAGHPRPGEYSARVRSYGHTARDWDRVRDAAHDLLDDAFYAARVRDVKRGRVAFSVFGVPCETFSVAPSTVRRPREQPEGASDLSPSDAEAVAAANTLVVRVARLCLLLVRAGGGFLIENPADRGDEALPFYWPAKADRASLRQMPAMRALVAATGAVWVFAPHCAFGADAQKWTMYLISAAALPYFGRLRRADCRCAHHAAHAYGRDEWGHFRALGYAQYTAELSGVLADGAVAAATRPCADGARGEIAAGAGLTATVRRAIDEARWQRPRYAALQRRIAVPREQWWSVPMPPPVERPPPEGGRPEWMDARVTDSDGSDDETLEGAPLGMQRPVRSRQRVHESLPLRIAYWMLWLPVAEAGGRRVGLERILRWRDAAAAAQRALRAGLAYSDPGFISVEPSLKHPHFRGRVVDSRNPADCVIVRASTRHTVVPGRQMDRAAFRATAAALGWGDVDPDILAQAGEGGIESRSACPFMTVMGGNHKGARENPAAVDAALEAEAAEGWVLGPFSDYPPFEPFLSLPRNVVLQARLKQDDSGEFFEWLKARITANSSAGPGGGGDLANSANGGIPAAQTAVSLPTALRHGTCVAVVDSFGDGRSVRGGAYSTDRASAFSFLLVFRGEWWQQGHTWDLPRRLRRMGEVAGAPEARVTTAFADDAGLACNAESWQLAY